MKITDISPCKKTKERSNIYINNEFAFALYNDLIIKHGLKIGSENFDSQKIIRQDELLKCINSSYNILSYGANSEKTLKDKLIKKGYDKDIIQACLKRLIAKGYIDDEMYGIEYTNSLVTKSYGKYIIKKKLYEKGIKSDIIELCLEQIDKKAYVRAAINYSKTKDYEKLFNSLMQRGYENELVKKIVQRESTND